MLIPGVSFKNSSFSAHKMSKINFNQNSLKSLSKDELSVKSTRNGTTDGEPPTWDEPFGFAC